MPSGLLDVERDFEADADADADAKALGKAMMWPWTRAASTESQTEAGEASLKLYNTFYFWITTFLPKWFSEQECDSNAG